MKIKSFVLKFFRNIRRHLLESNKVKSYFFYAIGEIALVVIGILIALQINNWNQDQVDRRLEKEYLNRLLVDVQADSKELNRHVRESRISLILAENILTGIGFDTSILLRDDGYLDARKAVAIKDGQLFHEGQTKDNWKVPNAGSQLGILTGFYSFVYTQTTINDLMSTGKIEVIRDRELRDAIQSYYNYFFSGADMEDHVFYPHFRHYQNAMNAIGIPYGSRITMEELKTKIEGDDRLPVAVANLYHAYLRLLNNSRWRKLRIDNLRSALEEALERL